MGLDIDKAKESAGEIAEKAQQKAVDIGAEVAEQAKKGIDATQKAIQGAAYDIRKKYYNPLFPEDYDISRLPQMIVIEDEADRKDIDVCEGAIGWTSTEARLTVVHLYHAFADESGLTFFPSVNLDAVYMVEPKNPKRYIELSQYFDTIENEKTAELIEVGRSLGAKKCIVETYEEERRVSVKSAKVKAKAQEKADDSKDEDVDPASIGHSLEASFDRSQNHICTTLSSSEFAGSDTPHRPELYWFRDDAKIKNLVESFCGENSENRPRHVRQEASKESTNSMTISMADKIEAALKKMDVDINFSIEGEAKTENRQTWALDIQF